MDSEGDTQDAQRVDDFDWAEEVGGDFEATEAEVRAMTRRSEAEEFADSLIAELRYKKSVRDDMKALLFRMQEKIEDDANKGILSEGSYVELMDLMKETFLCAARIR